VVILGKFDSNYDFNTPISLIYPPLQVSDRLRDRALRRVQDGIGFSEGRLLVEQFVQLRA
jgi:hypothetical protein